MQLAYTRAIFKAYPIHAVGSASANGRCSAKVKTPPASGPVLLATQTNYGLIDGH